MMYSVCIEFFLIRVKQNVHYIMTVVAKMRRSESSAYVKDTVVWNPFTSISLSVSGIHLSQF